MSVSREAGEGRGWGVRRKGCREGKEDQASCFPRVSYLGLSGHAQEEAEGALQRGACPASRAPFQLATATGGQGGEGKVKREKQSWEKQQAAP